jgi:DNA gyrase/topoisomerase IV subunit A
MERLSLLEEYSTQKRGGTGIFTFRVTNKTGDVSSARLLMRMRKRLLCISEKSKVIRADLKASPRAGQTNTQELRL